MRHLLIISCSKNKIQEAKAKALELYDGPYYKIIRKMMREGTFPRNLDVFILSAKYGLIESSETIELYDLKMTKERAKELHKQTIGTIKEKLWQTNYHSVYVNLGETYMLAISGIENVIPQGTQLIMGKGEIGERMSDMKRWITTLLRVGA